MRPRVLRRSAARREDRSARRRAPSRRARRREARRDHRACAPESTGAAAGPAPRRREQVRGRRARDSPGDRARRTGSGSAGSVAFQQRSLQAVRAHRLEDADGKARKVERRPAAALNRHGAGRPGFEPGRTFPVVSAIVAEPDLRQIAPQQHAARIAADGLGDGFETGVRHDDARRHERPVLAAFPDLLRMCRATLLIVQAPFLLDRTPADGASAPMPPTCRSTVHPPSPATSPAARSTPA